MAKNRPAFLAELRRRNVFRAAVLYAGAAWALAQGISQLAPAIGLPDAAARWFLIVAVIGFPFWLAFAWLYELTPQGIRRGSEVAAGESIAHRTARKLDVAIIGVLALAVVLLASGYFVRRHASAGPGFASPRNSLVVLPFTNLGGNPEQRYFSDGITEELTGAMGQNPALRVIAWRTAAAFRDAASASGVARQLNVANVLHGSVQREGDEVRITAELVDAATGYELWSAHYDSPFKDIFKVQDQVTEAIARALKVRFARTDLVADGTDNAAAHDLVLRGRALLNNFDAASLAAARRNFQQAIAIDPNYAAAHAMLADAMLALSERSDVPLASVVMAIRGEADKALTLDPRDSDVWVTLGALDSDTDPPDTARARVELQKALELNPSNAAAHGNYANLLPLKPALAEARTATQLSPEDKAAWNNLVADAQDLGDWNLELDAAETELKLNPGNVDAAFSLAFASQQLGRNDRMLAAFDKVRPATPLDSQQVSAGKVVYRALGDPRVRPQALAALQQLAAHQSNQDVAGNLLQMQLALGETGPALLLLEAACPANPLGCSDLASNPVYAALHGDPRFQRLVAKYNTTTIE